MKYILMHKDIEVVELIITDFKLVKIGKIYNYEHLPFSTAYDIKHTKENFYKWWEHRSLPLTRNDYSKIIRYLPQNNPYFLVIKANALSLDDQYWIKEEFSNVKYDDISFFSNKFNNDLGDLLVGDKKGSLSSYYSPDATSNGELKKRWKIIDGQRYLLKAGTKPLQQEIFNEIIASKIMDLLDIDHVKYDFIIDNRKIYCKSLSFINYNEDFVTAFQLNKSSKKKNHESDFIHLLNVYETLGIKGYKTKLNQMLFIDYLLGNIDRHLNNFGVIRDAKTLEFLRIAPIYDTGSCLGFNLTDDELKNITEVDWKPFISHKVRSQLDLIDDYSWLNIKKLKLIPKLVDEYLQDNIKYIKKERREAILTFLTNRINNIFKVLKVKDKVSYDFKELSQVEIKIIEYVKSLDFFLFDFNELMKITNLSYITIYRAVNKLVKKGILLRVGSRKRGFWMIR